MTNYTPHNFAQGSAEWNAHRVAHFNASEAAAMLGISPYMTRSELLKQKATGITPEVAPAQQRLYNKGHAVEAVCRPRAEKVTGELYPMTASLVVDGLPLSASYDGATVDDTITWECKMQNQALLESLRQGVIPDSYKPQLEQGLLIIGAEKNMFTAGTEEGDGENDVSVWYESDPELRARIIAGWKQFQIDLAAYVPPAAAEPAAVAKVVSALSVVLDMQVEGKLVSCNIEQYKPAALAYIEGINGDLKDDQDFANAKADAKYCRESAKKLETAIELALGKMGDVNTVINTVREIAAGFDAKGLFLEKLVDKRTDEIKTGIVTKAKQAYADHVAQLEIEISPLKLPLAAPDFGLAAKGKRTVATMQDAVDTAIATGKISADALAQQIRLKQAWLGQAAKGHEALFADMQSLIQKPMDDFQLAVKTRVDAQVAKEQKLRDDAAAAALAKPAVHPEQLADELFDKHHPPVDQPAPTANVVPMRSGGGTRTAPATPPTMKLGDLNTLIAPLSLTADGLTKLGFPPAATQQNSKLYHHRDLPAMLKAMHDHLDKVPTQQAA